MKKINKSASVPKILQNHPSPTSVDNIDRSVYADDSVKKQLLRDQFHRCAYCGCYLEGPYADVEHYRPKKTYRQSLSSPRRLGYYWLAYDWDNLLVSCAECNRTLKNDLFPLDDEALRDMDNHNISDEKPLILNPAKEDPSLHITYHEHRAIPVLHDGDLDKIGVTTINVFRLNDRAALVESRRRRWEEFEFAKLQLSLSEQMLNRVDIPESVKKTVRELLDVNRNAIQSYKAPDSEFSEMFQ
jgi:uncharacterized protein (TIGR02646 family)